jgi:hypothetical protein
MDNSLARRSGSLPGGVKVKAWFWKADGMCGPVDYLGTVDALVAVGALTSSMMGRREKYRKGDGRGLQDEHGHRFNLHRSATRGEPERMTLHRYVDWELAMQLPGVRELFPEGIPEPERESAPEKKSSKVELSRAYFCTTMLNTVVRCARGDHPSWPESMSAEALCLIERHVDAIREGFRRDGSKRTAPRPSFLRLVIDNTKGVSAQA